MDRQTDRVSVIAEIGTAFGRHDAAAGLVALEDGPKRLHEDHATAHTLAVGLAAIPGITLDVETVETNIVIFDISGTGRTSAEICAALKEKGILASGFANRIRMVTHLDVNSDDIDRTVSSLNEIIGKQLTANSF